MSDSPERPLPGITIVREFDATRERVFDAWVTPSSFAAWFGGAASEVPPETVQMDVRDGGSWSATMFAGPDRHEIPWSGRFIEVRRPARLVLTLSDVPGEDPHADEFVTVLFEPLDGDRTQMTFHQGGDNLTPEQYEQARAGWLTFFQALADTLV